MTEKLLLTEEAIIRQFEYLELDPKDFPKTIEVIKQAIELDCEFYDCKNEKYNSESGDGYLDLRPEDKKILVIDGIKDVMELGIFITNRVRKLKRVLESN